MLEARCEPEREIAVKATDPVCGMAVEKFTATASTEHEGRTYYFCSEGCRQTFEWEPEKCIS